MGNPIRNREGNMKQKTGATTLTNGQIQDLYSALPAASN
jgi:hypothetical protein